MTSLNIVISDVEEQRTLEGTKSTEKITAYVGGITPELHRDDPMFIVLNSFDSKELSPEVLAKIEANQARRVTQSSLERRAQAKREQQAYTR